jgi:hypothetical protein
MQINILNKQIELKNEVDSIGQLFSLIKETLQGTDYHFSHLVIDGIEVYDHFEETIVQSLDLIRKIDVHVKTIEQFVHECMASASEYLSRALPEIERFTDQFYQGPDQHTWSTFLDFVEGLQWIQQMITAVNYVDISFPNKQFYQQMATDISKHLAILEEGLQNQDYTLIADVIQYEVFPLLETFHREIKELTVTKEKYHDPH